MAGFSPDTQSVVGLGLRPPHIAHVLSQQPTIPWFEVHTDNYMGGGMSRALLCQVAEKYPLSLHGVNMNLGGADALDIDYLKAFRRLIEDVQPQLVSDHVCFTAHQYQHFHDLLPIPFTAQSLQNIVARVEQAQEVLGRTLLIENVSRYSTFDSSTYCELEFIAQICQRTGCGLLFDVNNAYVNQQNLGESFVDALLRLPVDYVGEIHLAGHSKFGEQLVDTHGAPVADVVWDCYRDLLITHPKLARTPTIIEWDNDLPAFSVLEAERDKAEAIVNAASQGNE